MQTVIGFFLALGIALAAYALRALSRSGAAAAVLLGTLVYGLGGLEWAVVLVAFFASSSLLSRISKRRKTGLEQDFAKGGRRDAGQVLANGGLAGLAVLLHMCFPDEAWPWLAFCGALAAANADTWATELGVLSRAAPRLLTTGRPAPRGASGAVSGLGLLAALGGSALIAGLSCWLLPAWGSWARFAGLSAAGLAGSLFDSYLGATLQAIYYCPRCGKETERHPRHACGEATGLLRGQVWMTNDLVNLLCTLAGALLAAVLEMI